MNISQVEHQDLHRMSSAQTAKSRWQIPLQRGKNANQGCAAITQKGPGNREVTTAADNLQNHV